MRLQSVITLDDTTHLNAADVVIMGRNIGSSDVGTAMDVWDSIKSPVISMNNWGLRGLANKAWWVPSDTCTNVFDNPDTVLQAEILVPDDTVFKGLTETTIDWWSGIFSVFEQDDENDDAGNGILLAKTTDNRPLFIRWDANEEFYSGAGHSPKGERAFIGCGNDQSDLNYFGFTEISEIIFFNELARMAGLPLVSFGSTVATLSDLTVDGTTVAGFNAATTTYNVELAISTTTTVAATPTDSKATVSGTGDVDVSSGSGTTTIVVTAEAGNIITYTINFTVSGS